MSSMKKCSDILTEDRLREVLLSFGRNWSSFRETNYDDYWKLWEYVDVLIQDIFKRHKHLRFALDKNEQADDYTGLFTPSASRGATPKLSRFPPVLLGSPNAWIKQVCFRWLQDLVKSEKVIKNAIEHQGEKLKDNERNLLNKHGHDSQSPLDSFQDKTGDAYFGIAETHAQMLAALDEADGAAANQKLLHVVVLVAIYSRGATKPEDMSAYLQRLLRRGSSTKVNKCLKAMHSFWGQIPWAPGAPDTQSRILAQDFLELLVNAGVDEIGPSTDKNKVRAFEASVSRCRKLLVEKVADVLKYQGSQPGH